MAVSRGLIIICSIVTLTLLVTIILIAASISVLTYNEVGLNYSDWFKTVEDKTYYHGIQFIGLGHSFLRYNIKLDTIEFSTLPEATTGKIKCRTKDGLELQIAASFQYKVDPDSIFKIYQEYGHNEKAILTRVALDVISETSTLYTSGDFFTKRAEIQQKMFEDLQEMILEKTWHQVVFFQLRSLALPDEFEKEIQKTEVKAQDILKSKRQIARDKVKFETNVEIAKIAQKTTIFNAEGDAFKIQYDAEAQAKTIGTVIDLQNDAYKKMKLDNKLNNDDLIFYMKQNLINDYNNGKLAIGMSQ